MNRLTVIIILFLLSNCNSNSTEYTPKDNQFKQDTIVKKIKIKTH